MRPTLALLLAAASLAACQEVPPPAPNIEVSQTIPVEYQRRLDHVDFAAGSAVLTPAETARLGRLVAEAGQPDGLRVAIGTAPGDTLAEARTISVTRALRTFGIVASRGGPPAERNSVALEFGRYTATAPTCLTDKYYTNATDTTLTPRQYGCTTAGNLAAMVADPGDLVAGRGHGPFDGVPAAAAIDRYRRDRTAPLLFTPDLPIQANPGQSPGESGGGGNGGGNGGGTQGGGQGGGAASP